MDFGVNNEVETRIRVHKFYGCIKGGRKGWSLWEGMLTRLAFGVRRLLRLGNC